LEHLFFILRRPHTGKYPSGQTNHRINAFAALLPEAAILVYISVSRFLGHPKRIAQESFSTAFRRQSFGDLFCIYRYSSKSRYSYWSSFHRQPSGTLPAALYTTPLPHASMIPIFIAAE
jgi:hypothetical protein